MLSAEVGSIEEDEAVPEEEEHTAADGLPVLPNTLMGSGSPSPSSCSRDERACLEVGKVQWFGFSKNFFYFLVSFLFQGEFDYGFIGCSCHFLSSLVQGDLLEQLVY